MKYFGGAAIIMVLQCKNSRLVHCLNIQIILFFLEINKTDEYSHFVHYIFRFAKQKLKNC